MIIKFVRIFAVSLLLVVLSAIKAPAAEPDWQWLNPLPQGNTLYGVWGSDGNNVFAVGENGTIMHYDGTGWEIVSMGDFPSLFDIWGSSASDIFAVGANGTILHYDGITWSPMRSGTTATLKGVWGSASNDVFAVGYEKDPYLPVKGIVLHYDGFSWSPMNIGINGEQSLDAALLSVWGSSATDVFVETGYYKEEDTMLHYDGATWSRVQTGYLSTVYDYNYSKSMWGSADRHFFAANHDSVLHFDGTEWTDMEVSRLGTVAITGLWGNAANDVFAAAIMIPAVGQRATTAILHYDGVSWNKQLISLLGNLYDVWGSSGSDVFAVGEAGRIYHYDGVTWSPMSGGFNSPKLLIQGDAGLWGSSGSDLFALGPLGTILHYNGTGWAQMSLPGVSYVYPPDLPYYMLENLWGSSPANVYASGTAFFGGFGVNGYGVILRYNGVEWTEAYRTPSHSSIADIWGASENDVFAVGELGAFYHFDGTAWRKMKTFVNGNFAKVWGSSGSDVYALTREGYVERGGGPSVLLPAGKILHFDGIAWSPVDPGIENASFSLVWGRSARDVYFYGVIFGQGAVVLHFDGSGWSSWPLDHTTCSSMWGTGNDLFLSCNGGLINRYDGFTWSQMFVGKPNGLMAIWADSGNDIFATGNEYYENPPFTYLWHYDGSAWSKVDVPAESFLSTPSTSSDLWGSSGNDVFATVVTDYHIGEIEHYDGTAWSQMPVSRPVLGFEPPPGPAYIDRGLNDIWGSSPTDVFAVGSLDQQATIFHYDGSTWTDTNLGVSGSFKKVRGFSGSDVFAMADAGTWHYDGVTWSPTGQSFLDIWGLSANDVYGLAGDGTISHYDGRTWSPWGSLRPEVTNTYSGRIWGSSANDLYVISDGTAYHFDGSAWNAMFAPYSHPHYPNPSLLVTDIWGSSQNDVFIIGTDDFYSSTDSSVILHYDGYSWTEIARNIPAKRLWGSPENNVYAFGGNGAILLYDRAQNPPAADPNPWSSNFDRDGISDLGVYFDRTGTWYLDRSSGGYREFRFGFAGTYPITGDFNGDGVKDFGVYNPQSGMWHLMISGTGYIEFQFGFPGTIPVVGDFDGEGATDYGVYDPSAGMWYLMQTAQGFEQKQFGFAGTQPVTGDFDHDGRSDIGVYFDQTGTWYVDRSGSGYIEFQFGFPGTSPVTGDFDGDGASDYGVYDPPTGMWYLLQSSQGYQEKQWGFAGTRAIP